MRAPSTSVARTFLIGVSVAFAAAWLAPELGKTDGALASQTVSKLGIIAIFFFQGVGLPTEEFRKSLGQWRLHAFVQAFCFFGMPLLTWALLKTVGSAMPPDLALGFLFPRGAADNHLECRRNGRPRGGRRALGRI